MKIHYLLVKQSDSYPAAHFRSGLFFCALVIVAMYYLPLSWNNPFPIIATATGFFLFGYILAHFRRFKRLFSFGHEMKEEVHQMALESLETYGLLGRPQTILIYGSLLERRIECLPSFDLVDALDYQGILKEKKKEFKKKNPKQLILAICNEIEEQLRQSGYENFNESIKSEKLPQEIPAQEDRPALETTSSQSDNTSAPRPLEKDEESPQPQAPDQNNSEDPDHGTEPQSEKAQNTTNTGVHN